MRSTGCNIESTLRVRMLAIEAIWEGSVCPTGIRPLPRNLQVAQPVGDGSRVVDVLLEWPGGRVAVEVDGPSHFLEDADGARTRLDTRTLLRNHTLRMWGITVVSVRLEDYAHGALTTPAFEGALARQLCAAGVPLDT